MSDNDRTRDLDLAAADAASWPQHDPRCLVCSRTGCGPFGAIICKYCEAQLVAIFGRGPDGELSERAFECPHSKIHGLGDEDDRASDQEGGAS